LVASALLLSCFFLVGKTGAVLQYNRCPVFLAALARRLLAVCAQHLFDDFRLTDPTIGDESTRICFSKLADSSASSSGTGVSVVSSALGSGSGGRKGLPQGLAGNLIQHDKWKVLDLRINRWQFQ
jgi:hypothetical protein